MVLIPHDFISVCVILLAVLSLACAHGEHKSAQYESEVSHDRKWVAFYTGPLFRTPNLPNYNSAITLFFKKAYKLNQKKIRPGVILLKHRAQLFKYMHHQIYTFLFLRTACWTPVL